MASAVVATSGGPSLPPDAVSENSSISCRGERNTESGNTWGSPFGR
jgi:hypothetical protein